MVEDNEKDGKKMILGPLIQEIEMEERQKELMLAK